MRPSILSRLAAIQPGQTETPVSTEDRPSIIQRLNAIKPESFDPNRPIAVEGSMTPTDVNMNGEEIQAQEQENLGMDVLNSFRRGVNQTQNSNYEAKLDSEQEVIDLNSKKQKQLIEANKTGQLSNENLQIELDKINAENAKAQKEIADYQEDINQNKVDIKNSPVSKMYQMKEAMIQAKGGESGIIESAIYTMPSTSGSSASLAASQMAATFGAGLISKAAGGIASKVLKDGSKLKNPVAALITAGSILGTLGYSRYQEALAEKGGQLEQNRNDLVEEWKYNHPGEEPSEEVMTDIRIQSRQGMDDFMKEQMALVLPDAMEAMIMPGSKVLGAFAGGRKLEQTIKGITDYNKYTRAAKLGGKLYAGWMGEKFEEGVQYAAGKRQASEALGLNDYEDQGFIKNMLTDANDVMTSIDYMPIAGRATGEGRYAEDKEFQFAERSGGMMAMMMGGFGAAKSVVKDISTFRETNKDLQKSGIANPEDKWFRLKDQIYKKHFDNNSIAYLLEGIRTQGQTTDEHGTPVLTQEQVASETANIKKAFDKYLEVSRYTENLESTGFLGMYKNKEHNAKLEALKSDLFHTSMNLTRYNEGQKALPSMTNINNLIGHQQQLVTSLESALGAHYTVRDIYNIDDRLKIANEKLSELKKQKLDIMATSGLKEEDLPSDVAIEQDNANKEAITNDLNLKDQIDQYNNLLKVKDTKSLNEWYAKNEARKKQNLANLSTAVNPLVAANQAARTSAAQVAADEAEYAEIEKAEKLKAEQQQLELERKDQIEQLKQRSKKQKELEAAFNSVENLSDISTTTPVRYQGMTGTIDMHQEEDVLMFTDNLTGKTYDISKDELDGYGGKLYQYSISKVTSQNPISDIIDVYDTANGVSVVIDGKEYFNNFSNPLAAINKDADGNIISINLETKDGKKRTFKKYAEEIAYSLLLHSYNKLENEGIRAREEAKQRLSSKISKQDLERKESDTSGRDSEESKKIEEAIAKLEQGIKDSHAQLEAELKKIFDEEQKKREELEKSNKINEQLKKDEFLPPTNESDTVNLTTDKFDGLFGLAYKRAKNWFKTATGKDDDKKAPEQRFHRFVDPKNKNITEGTKLQIVTRGTNRKLFDSMFDEAASDYEEKHKDKQLIETVYLLVVDKDGKPVYSNQNGKKLDSGTASNYVYATMLTEVGLKNLQFENVHEAAKAHSELMATREQVLALKDVNAYLDIIDTSNGVRVRERKDSGQRLSNPAEGRLTNNLREPGLIELPTIIIGEQKESELSNGQTVTAGKLYARDSEAGDFVDLIARKPSQAERQVIMTLIMQRLGIFPRQDNVKDISAEIEKIIYWGVPKDGPTEYTLGMKGDSFFLGEKEFTINREDPADIMIIDAKTGNEVQHEQFLTFVTNFLQNFKNVSVNSTHLKENNEALVNGNVLEFFEPIMEGDKTITWRQWNSYQEFLLANEAGREPMYGTDIPQLGQPRFRNHYLIYNPTSIKETPIKVDKSKTRPDTTPTYSTEIQPAITENITPEISPSQDNNVSSQPATKTFTRKNVGKTITVAGKVTPTKNDINNKQKGCS